LGTHSGKQVAQGFVILFVHRVIFNVPELEVIRALNLFQFQQGLDAKSHNLFFEHAKLVELSNKLDQEIDGELGYDYCKMSRRR
jgi:hypothetical protein